MIITIPTELHIPNLMLWITGWPIVGFLIRRIISYLIVNWVTPNWTVFWIEVLLWPYTLWYVLSGRVYGKR